MFVSEYKLTIDLILQVIMITAALCQSMSFGTDATGVIGTLCFWRFILGVGIGGNYPLRYEIYSSVG